MNPKILLTAGGVLNLQDSAKFRKQIFRFGRWVHPTDTSKFFEMTPEVADKVIANFKSRVMGEIPVMLGEHDSGPEHNKGMITDVIKTSDGIDVEVEFRDETTRKLAKDNLIHGVSAKLYENYKDHANSDREVGPTLAHVAIVQEPYIKNLRGWEPVPTAMLSDTDSKDVLYFSEDRPMTLAEILAKLKTEHNIDVDALRAEANKVATLTSEKATLDTAFSEYKKKHPESAPTDIQKDPFVVELSNKLSAQNENIVKLTTQLNEAHAKSLQIEKDARHKEAEREIEVLLSDGKIRPVDRAVYLEMAENQPEMFGKIKPTLQQVVDLSERGTSHTERSVTTASFSAEQTQQHIERYAKMIAPKK